MAASVLVDFQRWCQAVSFPPHDRATGGEQDLSDSVELTLGVGCTALFLLFSELLYVVFGHLLKLFLTRRVRRV